MSNLTELMLGYHSPDNVRPSWVQFTTILRSASGLKRLSLNHSGPSGSSPELFVEPTLGSPTDLNGPIRLSRLTYFALANLPQVHAIMTRARDRVANARGTYGASGL